MLHHKVVSASLAAQTHANTHPDCCNIHIESVVLRHHKQLAKQHCIWLRLCVLSCRTHLQNTMYKELKEVVLRCTRKQAPGSEQAKYCAAKTAAATQGVAAPRTSSCNTMTYAAPPQIGSSYAMRCCCCCMAVLKHICSSRGCRLLTNARLTSSSAATRAEHARSSAQ
jgi:hypothetical protein